MNNKPDQYTLSDLFREMELELIQSMKRNLKPHIDWEHKLGIKWEQWQSSKLRSLRRYKAGVRQVVRSYHPRIETTIGEALTNTFNMGVRHEIGEIKKMDIEGSEKAVSLFREELPDDDFFQVNKEKLDIIVEEMNSTFTNSDGLVIRKMENVYSNVLNKELFKFSAGTKTITKAIDEATKTFLDKGLDCIIYKNGAKVNIANYAEMYLRTAHAKVSLLAQGAVRDKLGVYTVRVSQHMNCSDLCIDYQNTILIDDVFTNIPLEDAKRMSRETGYTRLSVAISNGLFHPNCRHTLTTWFPHASSLPKSLTVTQKDRALNNYKKEQQQRALENTLRKWKRVAEGTLNEQDTLEAKDKVKALQREIHNHVKDNPQLRRDYWRERTEKVLGIKNERL